MIENENIEKTGTIFEQPDCEKRLIEMSFDSKEPVVRYQMMIDAIKLCQTNSKFLKLLDQFIMQEKNKPFSHRVIEFVDKQDILVYFSNNYKNCRAAMVADYRIYDLYLTVKLRNDDSNPKNQIDFIALPNSLSEIITGKFSDRVKLLAIERLSLLPNVLANFDYLFEKDYVYKMLCDIGTNDDLDWKIRAEALVKIKDVKSAYFNYAVANDKSKELKKFFAEKKGEGAGLATVAQHSA